jgi:hypothetical protein
MGLMLSVIGDSFVLDSPLRFGARALRAIVLGPSPSG